VRHERTGVHHLLCGLAERSAGLDRGAQHVSGGDLRNAVFLRDERGLRAFARSGRAKKDQTHVVCLPPAKPTSVPGRAAGGQSALARDVAGMTLASSRGTAYGKAGGAMKNWSEAMRDGVVSGALAALSTVAVLALRGYREEGSAAAPLNAVSHVYWGDRALHKNRTTMRYTGAGLATHVA